MRKVIQIQAAFICRDEFCKLPDHECAKCCYKELHGSFNDLESGYKEIEVEGFELNKSADDVGAGIIDARMIANMRFYNTTEKEREKIKKIYNITWERGEFDD